MDNYLPSTSRRARTDSPLLEHELTKVLVTLAASNYGNKILEGLQQLRREGTLCDYTLSAESMSLKVEN